MARAESALAKDPKNLALIARLGAAQVAIRQYREAIATYTRGLALAPSDTAFYRERGHRHLSVREFDQAYADLTKGLSLDSTDYGCLYHLGIIHFLRGDFEAAAHTFARALPLAPDSSERAGSTDWLWMSLSRAGHRAEAQALLDRHPDSLHTNIVYTRRLRVYRGPRVLPTAPSRPPTPMTSRYGDSQLRHRRLVPGEGRHDEGEPVVPTCRRVGRLARPTGFIVAEVELKRLGSPLS